MMSQPPKPSAAETRILRVLWEREPRTVRDIHEQLSDERGDDAVGYTTVLKQMQRMTAKGLIVREPGPGRSHRYRAGVGETDTKSGLFDRFVRTAFDGSVPDLVMHALGTDATDPDDIARIRALLDSLESRGRDN